MNLPSPAVEWVQLVDDEDRPTGRAEKLDAHRRALLHRAFSVFVFDAAGRVMLQRRADGKYHSGGLWTNTCCGHPRPDQPLIDEARRRLREEMGFECPLTPVGTLRYRLAAEGGLTEYEFDHLLCGIYGGDPHPDPLEASAWRWLDWPTLLAQVTHAPNAYTSWLREIVVHRQAELNDWVHAHCKF